MTPKQKIPTRVPTKRSTGPRIATIDLQVKSPSPQNNQVKQIKLGLPSNQKPSQRYLQPSPDVDQSFEQIDYRHLQVVNK